MRQIVTVEPDINRLFIYFQQNSNSEPTMKCKTFHETAENVQDE